MKGKILITFFLAVTAISVLFFIRPHGNNAAVPKAYSFALNVSDDGNGYDVYSEEEKKY